MEGAWVPILALHFIKMVARISVFQGAAVACGRTLAGGQFRPYPVRLPHVTQEGATALEPQGGDLVHHGPVLSRWPQGPARESDRPGFEFSYLTHWLCGL